jgi:uncharacterized protein
MSRACLALAALLLAPGCALFWEQPGTPLARAAHAGDLAAIRSLVAAGADPNEYDRGGRTPLDWAARGGHGLGPHRCRGEAAGRLEVVSALIDGGADINAVDRRADVLGASSGWTALHVALQHEQFATASLLLARGADPNIRSRQGVSVMATAADHGAPPALLKELLNRGFDPREARAPRR